MSKQHNVEDMYPLTPVQEGMLFHSLLAPPTSGRYLSQQVFSLDGELDAEAFERAWSYIVQRHAILRTAFIWENARKPFQLVFRQLPLPLTRHDWRHHSADDQERRLQWLLDADLEAGFSLTQPPLMRVALLRLAQTRHTVVWTSHHIILDGWSRAVLVQELLDAYDAYRSGGQPQMAAVRPFRDYVTSLSGDPGGAEAFWRASLAGVVAPTPLGIDRSTHSRAEGRPAVQHAELDAETTERLTTFAQRQGLTLNTLLQGAWALVLSRYSGERDVVLGFTSSGRPPEMAGVERMVGLFIATLPLRVDVDPQARVVPWLRDLLHKQTEALQFQNSSPAAIQEWSPVGRGRALFDSVTVFYNYPVSVTGEEIHAAGLCIRPQAARGVELSQLPLVVMGEMTTPPATTDLHSRRFALSLAYDTRRIADEAAERLLGHMRTVLGALSDGNANHLSDITILTPGEKHRLLVEWNATQAAVPSDRCLQDIFEGEVQRRPDAVALLHGDLQVTYATLNARANRWARRLTAAGIGRGIIVTLLLERGIDFVTGLLAVWKAGAAALPLDPRHPLGRNLQLVLDDHIGYVLTDSARASACREWLVTAGATESPCVVELAVSDDTETSSDREVSNLPPCATPQDLAYVMYTSGSTGRPKGVMVEHQGMLNHVLAKLRDVQAGASDSIAQNGPAGFDIVIWQSVGALLVGGRVCILPDEVAHDPQALLAAIPRLGISILQIVPALLRVVLDALPESVPPLEGLRWLVPTGEALPPDLCRRWLIHYPAIPVLNTYGCTECSDDQCHHAITEPPPVDYPLPIMSIGRPIANMHAYVLSPHGYPVAVGVTGELYLGGVGVGRGYLGQPSRTAERFLPDPFGAVPGARLYRTGDVVRYLPDGTLEFLQRSDDQIKVQGYRVEVGEIEAALQRHPAVTASAVALREVGAAERQLVAYLVPRQAAAHDAATSTPAPLEASDRRSRALEQAGDWQRIYDERYARMQVSAQDPSLHFATWISSYTNAAFSEEEVFDCLQDTIDRLMVEVGPQLGSVLEIGCGSGLLIRRLSPSCDHYTGTDIAAEGLRALQDELGQPNVTLLHRAAHELADLAPATFDLIILSEVVQYFPSVDYLFDVLEDAIPLLRPGGSIFLGDIRSLPLLELFHGSVQLYQADDRSSLQQLRQRIRRQIAVEKELLLDPALFVLLPHLFPRIGDVAVYYKSGRFDNEFTRFRYNVLLRLDVAPNGHDGVDHWLSWPTDASSVEALRVRLQETCPRVLGVRGIPNSRLIDDQEAQTVLAAESEAAFAVTGDTTVSSVGDLRAILRQREEADGGALRVRPEDLCAMGEVLGYQTDMIWAGPGSETTYDVVFRGRHVEQHCSSLRYCPSVSVLDRGSLRAYANDPMHGGPTGASSLAHELRAFLREQLPDYMVPARFITLEALPLTANGKVDRKALPAPDVTRAELETAYRAPRTPIESLIAAMWADALGIDRVGVHDDFFALGGHSLIATQLLARLRSTFRMDLPLAALFEQPTVAGVAAAMAAHEPSPGHLARVLQAIERIRGMSAEEKQQMLRQKRIQGV